MGRGVGGMLLHEGYCLYILNSCSLYICYSLEAVSSRISLEYSSPALARLGVSIWRCGHNKTYAEYITSIPSLYRNVTMNICFSHESCLIVLHIYYFSPTNVIHDIFLYYCNEEFVYIEIFLLLEAQRV